jgi:hypothetical protein
MFKFGLEAEAGLSVEQPENRAEMQEMKPQETVDKEIGVVEKYNKGGARKAARIFVAASMIAFGGMGAQKAMAYEQPPQEDVSVSDQQKNEDLGYGGQEENFEDNSGGQADEEVMNEEKPDAPSSLVRGLKAASSILGLFIEVSPAPVYWAPPPPPHHHHNHNNMRYVPPPPPPQHHRGHYRGHR